MRYFRKGLITIISLSISLTLLSCASVKQSKAEQPTKPNIIYILADDLGYGDLSCYGQEKFQTPNIDKLAARGMKFTQHYTGSAVCAPSRSTLMTGQHTGHTHIRGNRELKGKEGQMPLPASTFTIAEMLQGAGYKTGAFGKWGLGFPSSEGDPNNQGFEEFYGYNCQRIAHRYYPTYLWDNQDTAFMEGNDWTHTVTYAPDEIQKKTLEFIETNKDKPFFAFMPLVQPHAELLVPDDEIFAQFDGEFEEDPNRKPNHTSSNYGKDIDIKKYCSQDKPLATYASMIVRIDRYVGEVVAKLEELGIADNTLVIFVSDNGPHIEGGANPAFFNSSGGLRGVKRDLYEGGIRTPFIAVWPEKIKAGSSSDHVSAFWDMMPTFADLAGAETPASIDGISFLPTLLGKKGQAQHEYLYWELNVKGGRKAIRKGDWKGVTYNVVKSPHGPFQLYNLKDDPTEQNDLAGQYPGVVEELKAVMKEASTPSELFPFKMKK